MFSIGRLTTAAIVYENICSRLCGHRYVNSVVFKQFSNQTNNDENVKSILKARFPNAKMIEVEDISGGCGSMYEIYIESEDFANLRTVAQHKLVTSTLKEEIKKLHGLRIVTSVPK